MAEAKLVDKLEVFLPSVAEIEQMMAPFITKQSGQIEIEFSNPLNAFHQFVTGQISESDWAGIYRAYLQSHTVKLDGATRLALTEPTKVEWGFRITGGNFLLGLLKDETAIARLRKQIPDALDFHFI